MDKLLGLVLCGGESRRMGQDKGLLPKDGLSWARWMGEKILRLDIPVIYSIHPRQIAAYGEIFPAEQLIPDALDLPGPLNGLFTVHGRFPGRDILLLACDMLDMDAPTLQAVVDCYGLEKGYDFYAFGEGDWLQPFAAIYTAAGLDRVAAPADGRLQRLLRTGRTRRLEAVNSAAFNNYNTLLK